MAQSVFYKLGRQGSFWASVLLCYGALQPLSALGTTTDLTEVVRLTLRRYFQQSASSTESYQAFANHLSVKTPYRGPLGVFVTLSLNGKPRACWGSPYPQGKNVPEATVFATLGALTKEYRYKPIHRAEWPGLKPQVTVIKSLVAMDDLRGQNPLSDGLMVRQGSRSAVILPGEARDAAYQLTLCKMKAGLQPGQKFQMYRIIADVYQ